MTAPTDAPETVRDRRHRAIVDAARALATEHGADGFTVDQVAAAAAVSRRTVFNHFTGVDQLLAAVCEQVLADVTTELLADIDRLTSDVPPGPAGHRVALQALGEAARAVDLPTAIVTIHHTLGCPSPGDERAAGISRTAFEHVGTRLRARLRDRAPGLDPLDLELELALLTNGLALVAGYWLEQHPAMPYAVPAAARADWDRLLDRLLQRLHTPRLPAHSPAHSPAHHGRPTPHG